MFSESQMIFAAIALVGFIVLMVFSYRRDRKLHKKVYKNNYVVLIVFLLFVALLFFVKLYMAE